MTNSSQQSTTKVETESTDDPGRIFGQAEFELAKDKDLEIHPAAKTFPVLDTQLEEMIQSLTSSGQMDPVTVYGDKILDGQKRNLARKRLGQSLKCKRIADLDGLTPLEWVVRKNMAAGTARHLTDSQRALIGAHLCRQVYEPEAKQRMQAGKPASENERGKASAKAARVVNVKPNRVQQALKVRSAKWKDLEDAVWAGEVVISTAAKIAELPNADRKKALAAAKEKDGSTLRELLATLTRTTDGLGKQITPKMRPLFLAAERWQNEIRRLQNVIDWLKESADKPEARVLIANVKGETLKEVIKKIEASKPWCQCPYCKHFSEGACPVCEGRRFLTEREHTAGTERFAEYLKQQTPPAE